MHKCFQFVFMVLGAVSFASAQPEKFKVAPDNSTVAFTLGDILHTVHGTFHISSGDVTFDAQANQISGRIEVKAGSGGSGNATRDRRMSSDILDAAQYPLASFVPHRMAGTIAPSGHSTIQVMGIFTLHGTPHPLSVPMELSIDGEHCIAKTNFNIPYVQWGMKDPSTFVLRVAKEVSIDLVLVGQLIPNMSSSRAK